MRFKSVGCVVLDEPLDPSGPLVLIFKITEVG